MPSVKLGASFAQTLNDIKLVGDLTVDQLDLVNGIRLAGEQTSARTIDRLRACPKSCAFAVKLKWLFMEVEEREGIVDILRRAGNRRMDAETIYDNLNYEDEMSQLILVLRQLVKRGILETANLFSCT